jgi:hypothetical protein
MMRGQARSSLTIKGVDNLMIAETVPAHVTDTPPNPARTGQPDRNINYAGPVSDDLLDIGAISECEAWGLPHDSHLHG